VISVPSPTVLHRTQQHVQLSAAGKTRDAQVSYKAAKDEAICGTHDPQWGPDA